MKITPKITLGVTVVEITWEDAWSENGYYTLDSISKEKPYMTYSYGLVIRDDESGVTIAREKFNQDSRFRSVQHIPRGMITKVRILS